jgi:peptide/nickel transport system permease protein
VVVPERLSGPAALQRTRVGRTGTAGEAPGHDGLPPSAGVWRISLARFGRSRPGWFGAILVLLMVALAVLAPLVAPYPPLETSPREQFRPPSPQHLFGTDEFGRDILSRVLYGIRVTLVAGGGAVLLAITVGVSLGMLAGYLRGPLEAVMMRLLDLVLAFPAVLLAIGTIAVLGRSTQSAIIAIALITVPTFARLARASILAETGKEYVQAARALGAGHGHLLGRTLLPNVLPPIVAFTSVAMAHATLLETSLSFLGLGTQPPDPSLGTMVNAGRIYLRNAPWYGVFPGLFIMALILGLNLAGDALRDALDPRTKYHAP